MPLADELAAALAAAGVPASVALVSVTRERLCVVCQGWVDKSKWTQHMAQHKLQAHGDSPC